MTVLFNFRDLAAGDYTLGGITYTDHGDGSRTFANPTAETLDVLPFGSNRLALQIGADHAGRHAVTTLGKVATSGVVLFYGVNGGNTAFDIDTPAYQYAQASLHQLAASVTQYNFLRLGAGASARISYWQLLLAPVTIPRVLGADGTTLYLHAADDYLERSGTAIALEVESSTNLSGATLTFGAHCRGHQIAGTGRVLGPVAGETNLWSVLIEITRAETDKPSGEYAYNVDAALVTGPGDFTTVHDGQLFLRANRTVRV